MGAYDRLQPGLFIMRQGDRESKWHGHGPAPEYKGETAIHAMTMPPFYIIAQLKYTGTGFTKQTSSQLILLAMAHVVDLLTEVLQVECMPGALAQECRLLVCPG